MAPDDDVPSEPAPPVATATRELRGKDLLTKSADELAALDRDLDPEARAELVSWFDLPSRLAVEAAGDADAEPSEWDERQKRIAAASAAIDPALVARLEHHDRVAERLRYRELRGIAIDESILTLRPPSEERLAAASEPAYYTRTDDIDAALKHVAPQAILRDLYRPVTEYSIEMAPDVVDDQPWDARAEAKVAMAFRPERPEWPRPLAAGRDAKAAFREVVGRPWPTVVAEAKAVREAALTQDEPS